MSWFGHSFSQCPACLQIRHLARALSFKDSRFAIELPGRWPTFGHALSLSFSPFSGPWPPSPVLCYERYRWLSGPSHLKRQQGPAGVAVITLSCCLMHIETGICLLKSHFGGPLLDFPERQCGSHCTPKLLLSLGIIPQLTGFLLFPWVDFLRGESF